MKNGRLIRVSPDASHPTGGALCAKGRSAPEQVGSPLRLTRPLRRTAPRNTDDPGWVEISWDEALEEIADRLGAIRAEQGPEAVAFAVTTPSGTPMVDSFEWIERFVRCFGSPNLIYAVEVCGWHKDFSHALTFGRGIGVPDFEHSDAVVLWGHNPARTWLAQASRLAGSRQRGAKIVVVDPRKDGSAEHADLWIRIRPGADGALALGAVRHLIETGTYDKDFVSRWTNAPMLVDLATGQLLRARDFWQDDQQAALPVVFHKGGVLVAYQSEQGDVSEVELRASGTLIDAAGRAREYATVFELLAQNASSYTVERVSELTWVGAEQLAQFNALFEGAPRLAYHAWTGVGQHTNATQTERAIATLYALTGACDRKGGNLWTVSPPYRAVNEYEALLPSSQREKALGLADLPLGPPRLGWITARDFADAVLHRRPYQVSALMSFGSNFVVSQADTARNQRALRALQFHVHADMYMNPTAENADIVLPVNMPWEREALKCGFEITQEAVEHVQLRQKMLEPAGESRADYDIAFALALRLGMADAFFGGDIEAGWNYQLEPLGITVADLRARPEGMRFPQSFEYEKYAKLIDTGEVAGFQTPSKRVELYSESLLDIGQPPLAEFVEPGGSSILAQPNAKYPVVMSTAKSGWYVHTSHRHIASLCKKAPVPQVQISETLALKHGISDGEWARLETPNGHVFLQARLDDSLHENVAIADFGWWQGCESLGYERASAIGSGSFNINSILSDAQRDPVSGSVPLRAVQCRISRATELNRGRWNGQREFRLIEKRLEADDIASFTFARVDGGALPDFLPGQHVVVSVPGFDAKRAYSLTGPNVAPATLNIAVRLARADGKPDGVMSRRLHGMSVGDHVLLSPPSGVFTLPTSTTRPVILMASGVGITPFIGYLEALAQKKAHAPKVLLVNICRNSRMHPFAARLRELAAALGTVRIITVYWDPLAGDRFGIDYDYPQGPDFDWIDDALVRLRPLAYLCGSPAFLEQAQAGLANRGVASFDIFSETFSAAIEVPATLTPQTVRINGESTSFNWTPEMGSLLDAADRAHVNLPSGCRVGQCESCSIRIVSGEVAHLSPYDGPPDSCLACRAVPVTPLVLRR